MPTTRRRRTRGRMVEFSEGHREQLLTGRTFFCALPYGDPWAGAQILDAQGRPWGRECPGRPFDELLAREHWQLYRDELHADAPPGTRPWAWWLFDAPEARHVVGTGAPACLYEHVPGQPLRLGAIYESEAEYLARHGLLTAADRRAMVAEAG